MITALLIPIGGLAADYFMRRPQRTSADLYARRMDTSEPVAQAARVFLACLGAVCVTLFVIYVSRQESWPLYTLLVEQSSAVARAQRLLASPSEHGYMFGLTSRYLNSRRPPSLSCERSTKSVRPQPLRWPDRGFLAS